ncbi:MAG TPA: hypothetical protein VIL90_07525 [Puia sp.]
MKNLQQRIISFLVVWLTMFSSIYTSGQNISRSALKRDFLHLSLPGTKIQKMTHNTDYPGGLDLAYRGLIVTSLNKKNDDLYPVTINTYNSPQAIFCKMEWEIEKETHIPLRFRLGSLADCNMLEGKH